MTFLLQISVFRLTGEKNLSWLTWFWNGQYYDFDRFFMDNSTLKKKGVSPCELWRN
jgi:hypothetical protein